MNGRRLLSRWFQHHGWLVCSGLDNAVQEGLFCRDCLFFGNPELCKGAYVYPRYRQYNKATASMKNHTDEAHHKHAEQVRQQILKEELSGGASTVAAMITSHSFEIISLNRAMLESVILPLLFLCVQGLAIRGSRYETQSYVSSEFMLDGNPGNYCALLRRLRHHIDTLKKVFLIGSQQKPRASYHSPPPKVSYIHSCGLA